MKILFTHNTAMWYRLEFFRMISQVYDVDLVFTHPHVISDIYDDNLNIKHLEDVNYTLLENRMGFASGLVSKLLGDYDVVVGCSWDSPQELIESIVLTAISTLRRKPLIIWREDWDWKTDYTLKDKLLERIVKLLVKRAQIILVPGTLHKEYFTEKLGKSSDEVVIMPNVSNISRSPPQIEKDKKNKTILYVGRLITRKGVIYLLDAYKKLTQDMDNTRLIIVGTGPLEDQLKKHVEEENIADVTFTGRVDNNRLEEYYKQANLTVIPSINYGMADPWVFVLNEAMYYSNPIIATDAVGAGKDLVRDNGIIVEEKNTEQLYNAMHKILSDDKLEEYMSQQSRKIIEDEYQYEDMAEAFIKAIKTVEKE